jgi:hypothetical protein
MTVDIDLRQMLGVARDQGKRPTCLVFAVSAAHEASRSSTDYLSTEFLFFTGAQRSHRDPRRGLSTTAVREALSSDGQPVETAWPYQADSPIPSSWKVPPISEPAYKATATFMVRSVAEVRDVLGNGKPVLLIVSVTTAMYTPDSNGIIRRGPNDSVTAGRHALLAIGSGHLDDDEYILVRNSWGLRWGDQGHGWLPDSYLLQQLQTTGVIS